MKDDWSSQDFAKHWDETSHIGNPARKTLLELLTAVVKSVYRPGTKLLDLGIGSGQVEEQLINAVPDLDFVGVDSSDAMIKLAAKRLTVAEDKFVKHDLADVANLKLADDFSVVISVQALHELTDPQKQAIFKFVHEQLANDGYYLIADRFSIPVSLDDAYAPIWDYLEENAEAKSGKNFEQYAANMRGKQDATATPQEHILWLEEAGFDASLLYLTMDRGLIVARKTES